MFAQVIAFPFFSLGNQSAKRQYEHVKIAAWNDPTKNLVIINAVEPRSSISGVNSDRMPENNTP